MIFQSLMRQLLFYRIRLMLIKYSFMVFFTFFLVLALAVALVYNNLIKHISDTICFIRIQFAETGLKESDDFDRLFNELENKTMARYPYKIPCRCSKNLFTFVHFSRF